MTVFENLAFPLRNRKIPEDVIKNKVTQIAEMLELTSTLYNRASGLTADGKQKISLGRGLARSDVNVIMFDEPLTVIDPHLKWILRSKLKEIGNKLDYKIGISGTHPTANPLNQKFVNTEGYNWVANQLNYYAKNNITFALHVHIAVPNPDLSIKAVNGLRRWIPPLLALSTNSPFFNGVQTGMRSSRTFQFGSFPRTNIPEKFDLHKPMQLLFRLF